MVSYDMVYLIIHECLASWLGLRINSRILVDYQGVICDHCSRNIFDSFCTISTNYIYSTIYLCHVLPIKGNRTQALRTRKVI